MQATWSKAFEMGIKELDNQHKELFRLLRDLEQMILTECKQYKYETLVNTMCEIREYITYHFYTEEKYMEEINYPDREKHVKMHEAFKEKVNQINYIELQKNAYEIIKNIKIEVEDLIMYHVLIEDQKIVTYIKKND